MTQTENMLNKLFEEWGFGPGPLFPSGTSVGWHPYSELDPGVLDNHLQIMEIIHTKDELTITFRRSSKRIIVIDIPSPEENLENRFSGLWQALLPLQLSWDNWDTMATRVNENTYILDPQIWPGAAKANQPPHTN